MANTTNLNLSKLAGTEKLKSFPSPYNDNMDAIDGAFGAGFGVSGKPSVNAELNSLGDGLAILANGNTHPAITSGQYVYVRGHGTLTDGLYIATANIAENGTLSGSNLTADSSGGLNSVYSSLNSKIATSYYVITGIGLIRFVGNIAIINFTDSPGQIPSDGLQLPYTFVDDLYILCQYYNGSSNTFGELQIKRNGKVYVRASGIYVNATYVLTQAVAYLG